MKTSLTLSTVLFALTLTPAAFANGAQDQTQANQAEATTSAAHPSITVFAVQSVPQVASVNHSVLEQLERDFRAELVSSLRASSALVVEALEIAAPAPVEVARKPLGLTSR